MPGVISLPAEENIGETMNKEETHKLLLKFNEADLDEQIV